MIFTIKSLGIVIQILKEPVSADFDCSGIITGKEAFMLGLALSLDAFSSGFGAAIAGYKMRYLPLIVGIFQLIALNSGMKLANTPFFEKLNRKATVIPGIILILLGIVRF